MIHDHPMILWPPFHWEKMENPFGMNLFEARRPRSEITETVAFHHDKTTQARAWPKVKWLCKIKTNTMIFLTKVHLFPQWWNFKNATLLFVAMKFESTDRSLDCWLSVNNQLLLHTILFGEVPSKYSSWEDLNTQLDLGMPRYFLSHDTDPWDDCIFTYTWLTFCGKCR